MVVMTSLASAYAFSAPGSARRRPAERAEQQAEREQDERRNDAESRERGRDVDEHDSGEQRADDELALRPDVEDARAEGDGDGHASEHQDGRLRERGGELAVRRVVEDVSERAEEQLVVHRERVVTEPHREQRVPADQSGDEAAGERECVHRRPAVGHTPGGEDDDRADEDGEQQCGEADEQAFEAGGVDESHHRVLGSVADRHDSTPGWRSQRSGSPRGTPRPSAGRVPPP